jgi:hypothetical protein
MSQLRSPDQAIYMRINQGPVGTQVHHVTDQTCHHLALAVDGHYYPPQSAQDLTSQRLSHSSDTSIPLFTLYLRISEEYDRRKYELLKGDLDSILVFVSHCVGYRHAISPFTRKL